MSFHCSDRCYRFYFAEKACRRDYREGERGIRTGYFHERIAQLRRRNARAREGRARALITQGMLDSTRVRCVSQLPRGSAPRGAQGRSIISILLPKLKHTHFSSINLLKERTKRSKQKGGREIITRKNLRQRERENKAHTQYNI